MRILVTGKNGQLGSEIKALESTNLTIKFKFTDSKELDIRSRAQLTKIVDKFNPDVIINCAAYTAVDLAEDEAEKADDVNHKAVKLLAEICSNKNIRLIHISTDYVFNGEKNIPYIESDQTDPVNEYGNSKLNGEISILESNVQAIIIRTSWVYSSFGNNFVKTMIRLGRDKNEINVVADQYGSPTNAKDLAEACIYIALSDQKWKAGTEVYHYSNQGEISWCQFAKEIMSISNLNCEVKPISTAQFPTKAKRPEFSTLNKDKIIQDFDLNIPDWNTSLIKNLIK